MLKNKKKGLQLGLREPTSLVLEKGMAAHASAPVGT